MSMIITLAIGILAAPPAGKVQPPDPLVKGLIAVRGHMRHVTPAIAKRLVKEAREITSRIGWNWVKPHELLGLAITESDLRLNLVSGLDCGITQVRVNQWARGRWRQKKLCQKIARSTLMSMAYTMAELTKIKHRYCWQWSRRGRKHFMRCVFASYNSGPSMRNVRRCRRGRTYAHHSKAGVEKAYRRCVVRWRYHLKVLCFAKGVKLGRRARRSCRHARSLRWIRKAYRPKIVRVSMRGR